MRLFGVLSSGLALTGRANQGISGVCVNTSSTSLNSSIGIECDELAILMQTDALAKAKKNEYEEIIVETKFSDEESLLNYMTSEKFYIDSMQGQTRDVEMSLDPESNGLIAKFSYKRQAFLQSIKMPVLPAFSFTEEWRKGEGANSLTCIVKLKGFMSFEATFEPRRSSSKSSGEANKNLKLAINTRWKDRTWMIPKRAMNDILSQMSEKYTQLMNA